MVHMLSGPYSNGYHDNEIVTSYVAITKSSAELPINHTIHFNNINDGFSHDFVCLKGNIVKSKFSLQF